MFSAALVGALHVGLVVVSLFWPKHASLDIPQPAGGVIPVAYLASATPASHQAVEPPPPPPEPEPVVEPPSVEPDPLPDMPVIESPLAQFEAKPDPVDPVEEDEEDEVSEPDESLDVEIEPETQPAEQDAPSETNDTQPVTPGENAVDKSVADAAQSAQPGPAGPAQSHVQGPAGVPGGPIGNAKDAWHASVVQYLEQNKDYPFMSRRQRHEGVVLMAISINRAGDITAKTLLQGCPHDRLNTEAMELMDRVGALPPPPEELDGDLFHLIVPIEFFLES